MYDVKIIDTSFGLVVSAFSCALSQGEDAVPPCDGRIAVQGQLLESLTVRTQQ